MASFWRTWTRRRTGAGRLPPRVQLELLLDVLDEAAWMERGTDWALAACGESTPATGVVSRRAGALMVDYHRLGLRLDGVPFDGDRTALAAELGTLLYLRQALLRAGLQLAFSATPRAGSERVRAGFNGLAGQATRLRELRDRVAAGLAAAAEPVGGPAA